MNPFKQYATDDSKETNGVWIDGDEPGVRHLIARFGNPKHLKALEKYKMPYKAFQSSPKGIPQHIQNEITVNAMADAILLGWEGYTGDDGKPLVYNQENARALLSMRDFRDIIAGHAAEMENYRKEETAAILGNSQASSDGPSKSDEPTPKVA